MQLVFVLLALVIPATMVSQIPPSNELPPEDVKPFHNEIRRVEALLETAGDKCTVNYALARTWAAGGQFREAMDTLQQTADLNVGLTPRTDEIFAPLRETKEFERLLRQVRKNTPPIVVSQTAFTIGDAHLFPEGIAYSPRSRQFFVGSTYRNSIIACTFAGECQTMVKEGQDGLGSVLGLRINPTDGSLWAAANSKTESGLFHYSVPSGKLIGKYTIGRNAATHLFNDLVVSREGDVFVTDTRAGTLYWVSHTSDQLEVFHPDLKIESANGIAISEEDSPKLYVAGFPEGITVIDVASRSFRPMPHPEDLCLATTDGLYFFDGDLVAIQNGVMVPRVVRFRLSSDLGAIEGFEVLERRNPVFEGITTGAIADGALYFMANTQLDKVQGGKIKPGAQMKPIQVLRLDL